MPSALAAMPSFNLASCAGCHAGGLTAGKFADDPGAVGFQFEAGIEHQHGRAARQQRLGAGDARRTGTDDAMHILPS